jgi:4-hydroxybenzoate polyprenyltransferase
MNDMLDLNSDRLHATKKQRPFASGDLPLFYGFAGAPVLLFAAVLVALTLPTEFLYVLATYWTVTCLYSFALKRLFLVDAITLAILYTLRIIAGSAAIGVVTTNWLLGFSVCLFFGLALLKRFTELNNLQSQGESEISGRAYTTASLRLIPVAGAFSSLLAVGVFAFYINAPDITRLYSMPALLWLICPLLLYLLARIWSLALKGKLHEDPILFAITDRRSQLTTLLCAAIIWAAI